MAHTRSVFALEAEKESQLSRVRAFQAATTGLGKAPFPVVVAPFGLTLGGGAEMTLHASAVQALDPLVIVDGVRTAMGRSKGGMFRNVRPDDMLAHVLKGALAQVIWDRVTRLVEAR